ncbi:hypothetical protein AB0L74_10385 [Streptomyces sp. NPDC052020]|uniref:hypothetical protein n=1 Tax=Streptomyces sp. NPDC052020 TaxID=3155677 RepID=UPI00343B6222
MNELGTGSVEVEMCRSGDVYGRGAACATDCTWKADPTSVVPDYETLGVLILYCSGGVADWVDVIVTDLALQSLTAERLAALEDELGAPMSKLEMARQEFDREHSDIPGSSAFTIIRLSRVGISVT